MLHFEETGEIESVVFSAPIQTELVEIPVIIIDSSVKLQSPAFRSLSREILADMATAMGGEVGYLKVRAYYKTVETQMCTSKECWRPAVEGTYKCDSHPSKG